MFNDVVFDDDDDYNRLTEKRINKTKRNLITKQWP